MEALLSIASARAVSRSTRRCPPRRACCARTGAGLCTRSARTGPCARRRRDTSTPPRGAPWTRATPRRSPRTAGAIGSATPSRRSGRTRRSTSSRERCACPLPVASPRSAACGTPRVLPPREPRRTSRSRPRAARWRWCACGRARRAVQTEATTQTTRGARASRFWRRRSRRTTPAACCARSGTPTPTGTWCFCSPSGTLRVLRRGDGCRESRVGVPAGPLGPPDAV